MAAAAGAAEAPVLAGFTLALIMILAWVVLMGLRQVWVHTFSVVLEQLADMFRIDAWVVHLDPLNSLRRLDRWVLNQLAGLISLTDGAIGFFFHESARLQGWIADETWQLARDTYHLGGWLVHTYIPTYVHGLTDVLHAGQRVVIKQVTRIEHTTVKVIHETKVVAKDAAAVAIPGVTIPYLGDWQWLHKHWKALTAAVLAAGGLALPLPVAWPTFRRLWKDIEAWRHVTNLRIKRLEGLLAAAGLATAVAAMTGTSFRCWRGQGNIARALRHICGVPRWLLDVLLLGVVEAFVLSDLCDFSDLLIKEAEKIRPALLELVDVEDALIGCHGTVKPIDFDLAPLSLPPMYGPSALAA